MVTPPKPGQPGVDLGGKSIPAPPTGPQTFYAGANLTRQKTEISASVGGFLRVGGGIGLTWFLTENTTGS